VRDAETNPVLVRKLVALHGGCIRAFSAGQGHGNEFLVCLPGIPLTKTEMARHVQSSLEHYRSH
jgi:hypothetical protein